MIRFEVVTLDGPGGVGKSTAGKSVAARLGFYFLSTGQIYRALTWMATRRGWKPGEALPGGFLEDARIEVLAEGGLRVNGEHPGEALFTDEISHATSVLSAMPEVRELSNRVQRATVKGIEDSGQYSGVVLEGRDMGTVVFPDARHKFFLTAKPEVRALRRYDELKHRDPSLKLEEVAESLNARDHRDSKRETAPLKADRDAITVDTSGMAFEDVVELLADKIQATAG